MESLWRGVSLAARCMRSRSSAEPRCVRPVPLKSKCAGSTWSMGASSSTAAKSSGTPGRLASIIAVNVTEARQARCASSRVESASGMVTGAPPSRSVATPDSVGRSVLNQREHGICACIAVIPAQVAESIRLHGQSVRCRAPKLRWLPSQEIRPERLAAVRWIECRGGRQSAGIVYIREGPPPGNSGFNTSPIAGSRARRSCSTEALLGADQDLPRLIATARSLVRQYTKFEGAGESAVRQENLFGRPMRLCGRRQLRRRPTLGSLARGYLVGRH